MPGCDCSVLSLLLLLLISSCQLVLSCPTNETVNTVCHCDSGFNGISLNCSGRPGLMTLEILRANQLQLGLIQELVIQNASISQLPAHVFKGLYIKSLNLAHNRISTVDDQAFDGLQSVLQTLILTNNSLTLLPTDGLNGMATLSTLSLANNSIGDLMSSQSFANTPKIFDLDLSGNKICDIQKSVFDAIKHSVQTLNLGNNCLKGVPASAIRGFKQLLALHLHSNRISQLEPLQFMNLPLLNLINLAKNNIHEIHRQAFLNVPNLKLMYLSENNISNIYEGQFRHFESLEMLDLTKNRIKTVKTGSFANMTRLSQLYLGDNLISHIEPDSFANSTLVILLMPNNRLTKLSDKMLTNLPYVQQFSLKNNQLTEISQGAFYEMPSLVIVDLSYNQLTTLPENLFLSQLNMFLVDLTANKLTATPNTSFNRRVMTVILQENPLVCTERVHMLQNGVGVYVPNNPDLICKGLDPRHPGQQAQGSAFVQATAAPTVGTTEERRPLIRPVGPINTAASSLDQVYRKINSQIPNHSAGSREHPATVSNFPTETTRLPSTGSTQQQWGPLPVQNGAFAVFPSPNEPNPTLDRFIQPNPNAPHITPPIPRNYYQPTAATRPRVPNIPVRANPIDLIPGSAYGRQPGYINPGFQQTQRPQSIPKQVQPQIHPPMRPPSGPTDQFTYGKARTVRPLPVPYLNRNALDSAHAVTGLPENTPNEDKQTLPPEIITAAPPTNGLPAWTDPRPRIVEDFTEVLQTRNPDRPWQDSFTRVPVGGWPRQDAAEWLNQRGLVKTEDLPPQIEISSRKPPGDGRLPPEVFTVPKKPPYSFEADAATGVDLDTPNIDGASTGSATTTIVICLTVVIMVMVAVFVTLCVVRHRVASKHSESSTASRTSAYVAAQAARLNYPASSYASLARGNTLRPTGSGDTVSPAGGGWLRPGNYPPASAYGVTSSDFFKH